MTFVTDLSAQELGRAQEAQQARDMLESGTDNQEVFDETGWFVDPIGEMKTEIDDRPMEFTGNLTPDSGPMALPEAIDHPELFKAVPELQESTIEAADLPENIGGAYMPGENHTVINNDVLSGDFPLSAEEVVAHETQHAVQDAQGTLDPLDAASDSMAYEDQLTEHEAWDVGESVNDAPGDDTPTLLEDADEAGVTEPSSPGIGGA